MTRLARRLRRLRTLVLAGILLVVINEGCVAQRANRLAPTVSAAKEFAQLPALWDEHDSLAGWSALGGFGVRELRHALTRQTQILAEQVIGNYRTPVPSVRETQWLAAADALRRALAAEPENKTMRGSMRYAEGHLHRINGDSAKTRKGGAEIAKREFADAVTAFRDAAELRPGWPDPFLGLARTFIYGMEDIDRGADAMNQAQKLGYAIGTRETAQLADGYRVRGETLWAAASKLEGMPQQRDLLVRCVEAYRKALEEYSRIADQAGVAFQIKLLQVRVEKIEQLLGGGTPPHGGETEGLPWA